MPRVIYIQPDTTITEVDVPAGVSLMHAAVNNSIDGILGDCGGAISCATCHVFVEPEFMSVLPAVSDGESQMLDYTAMVRQPNSRLCCQLIMSDELDGLTVRIADQQA